MAAGPDRDDLAAPSPQPASEDASRDLPGEIAARVSPGGKSAAVPVGPADAAEAVAKAVSAGSPGPAGARRHASKGAAAPRRPALKKQQENLTLLERFSRSRGLKVSSGKLVYAGLRLKSGRCVYKDEPWLCLDRAQPYEDQLELFRRAFAELKIEGLPDEVKSVLYPEGLGL